MRPHRLQVEGFTAFRQPTVVDFTGADLFALVGPTGSGKTSLLDAITFALYGSVPRLDDRRAVAPVISQNLTEARLRLDFGVGADTYTVVRIVRASKAGASTKEARLERAGEVLAGNADEVGAAVSDLLGLTYDHFTTCVSLPQGQFARFLHDKPRDRQDLLVRLLDLGIYDKVASAARQRAMVASGHVDVLDGQLTRLAEVTPERLDAARAQVAILAELTTQLADARPRLDELAEHERAARAEAERCERQLAGLRELQAPDGVGELSDALAAAAADRRQLTEAEEAAASLLAAADARLAELPARVDLEQLRRHLLRRTELDELIARGEAVAHEATAAVDEHRSQEAEAEAARERCGAALERLRVERRAHALVPELRVGEACPVCRQTVDTLPEGHAPDLAAAESALADAERQLKDAARALSDARTHHARVDEKLARIRQEAADLDTRLAASHGVLATVVASAIEAASASAPEAPAPSVESTTRRSTQPAKGEGAARAAAGDQTQGAGEVLTLPGLDGSPVGQAPADDGATANADSGSVTGNGNGNGNGHGESAAQPGPTGEATTEGTGDGDTTGEAGRYDDHLAAVESGLVVVTAAEQAVEEARRADRAARQARAAADRHHEELRQQESEARRAFDQARDRLAALEPPAPERRDLAADWRQLVAWADERRPDLEQVLDRHRRAVDDARRQAAEQLDEILTACREAGVAVAPAPAWPGEAVAAAHARAEEEVRRTEAELAEVERLRRQVAETTRERQVAETLAGHLAANRFEKWLLDEAVHRLVGGASTILADLTAGGYALSVDRRSGGFTVIDHANASQPRPARTLSGGETFLASLALALALADQVAELAAGGAARLESLFLDEGFGTLDADTLDVVATALDELGARGRMVGVVTHVRELADRLPVRFEVRKVAGTASVERVDA